MNRIFIIVLLCLPVFTIANKRSYITHKTNATIIIDGNLNDEAWSKANWSGNFSMYYPYDDKKASRKTEFAIIYDANFIYVAIKAYDSEPDKIVKRLTRRDNIDGDWLGIQFDSYHDLQTSYEFKVSAAGSKSDMFLSGNGESKDFSWNAIWWAKTGITQDAWVVEMKIPFSQLRFVNRNVQTWGLQLGRYIQRDEEISLWARKERDAPGWVHHFGEMEGIVDITPKKVFDLYPYVVGSIDSYKKDEDNPFLDGSDLNGNMGLDGKIGLTNNLTLDFTINPDFGQVEADPSTVNLSGFELFFREQRPFFVEGSSIIDFPLMFGNGDLGSENLFYSRRIGRSPNYYPEDLEENDLNTEYAKVPNFTRILGAAKITGRTKEGLSIGVLESITAKESAKIQGSDGSTRKKTVEPMTNYTVVSLEQDIDKGNTLIGGMFTSTNRLIDEEHLEFLRANAYTGGLSFTQYFKEKTWFVSAKTNFSHVNGTPEAITNTQESSTHLFQRPDANHINYDTNRTSLNGYGGNFYFGKEGGGRLSFVAAVYLKSPELELNDVGYVRHVDDIVEVIWAGYNINKPFSIFKEANFNIDQWSGFNFAGDFLGMGTSFKGHFTLKNNYNIGIGTNYHSNSTSTSHLRGGPSYKIPQQMNGWIWAGSDSRKMVRVEGNIFYSEGFEGSAYRKWLRMGVTIKPMKFLELELSGRYNPTYNQQQYVTEVDYLENKRYIMGTIRQDIISASLRINCNLTPDLSIEYWGQPFFATGTYNDKEFKYASSPTSNVYNERFNIYNENQISRDSDFEEYSIDENQDGIADYTFVNPDFNTKVFLSNMVLRWEYRPGSVLFFVWSQNREDYDVQHNSDFSDNVNSMFDFKPHDTFLIKLSYRIGI